MSSVVTVILPHILRPLADNRAQVQVAGQTIREIIDALELECPGIRFRLCFETGELRPFVNVFLNREHIRHLQGLDTPVPEGAQIHILQSVAGG